MTLLTDRTVTIRASVRDVQFELLLAVALVVMVIFLFLRNVAATLIPSVAVPLSLVGTFGVMYLAGFSINNLTLMALTIATGFVVDDAIVMIENIARYIEKGETPLDAALKGAKQIGFTIISLTFSLIAVLIPLLFMGDVVGRLFREFAITLAVAILHLGRRLADADADDVREAPAPRAGERAGPLLPLERRAVRPRDRALRRRCSTGCSTARPRRCSSRSLTLVLTVVLYIVDPQGLLPGAGHGRDPGHLRSAADDLVRGDGRAPAGAGRSRSCRIPAVASLSSFIGVDGTNTTLNSGRMLINLKPLRAARRERRRGHPAPAAERCATCRASRSTCSRCRT